MCSSEKQRNIKIILSRKGFDSNFGGMPSPIMPDGSLLSLPIPWNTDSARYSDIYYKNYSYYEIISNLKKNFINNGNNEILTKNTKCHLDPDLYFSAKKRKTGWRPSVGQMGQAQTHLNNQGICEGDIFLFFGWFKKTKEVNNMIVFDSKEPDLHAIFGYMQIGDKWNKKKNIPTWLNGHPHLSDIDEYKNSLNNCIYIASNKLAFNNRLAGSGVFDFDKSLVLTKDGCTRSRWSLPDCFRDVGITYHTKESWKKEGYFQSAHIGQEFVVSADDKVINWVKNIINKNAK